MDYKGYLIKPSKNNPKCFTIATEGRGGKIPNVMEGMFTSRGAAMQIVDLYLESKEKNVKQNDKEGSKGGS